MSIIIISSDTREIEKNIAENVTQKMEYHILDQGILTDVAVKYQIESERLKAALETPPSLFKKLLSQQWHYDLACIEAEVLERLMEDNIVCYGLGAGLYVTGVAHAMKVRVLSGKSRGIIKIAEEKGLDLQKAEKFRDMAIQKQKKWSMDAYNCDETDLSRYDLVINLDQIDPAEAVKTITGALAYRKFQVMTYSMKCLTDLALAAKVNVVLLKSMTDISSVEARDGSVVVTSKGGQRQKRKRIENIKKLAGNIEGVAYVEVHVA